MPVMMIQKGISAVKMLSMTKQAAKRNIVKISRWKIRIVNPVQNPNPNLNEKILPKKIGKLDTMILKWKRTVIVFLMKLRKNEKYIARRVPVEPLFELDTLFQYSYVQMRMVIIHKEEAAKIC